MEEYLQRLEILRKPVTEKLISSEKPMEAIAPSADGSYVNDGLRKQPNARKLPPLLETDVITCNAGAGLPAVVVCETVTVPPPD
jgi:hypothetical protein